MTIFPRESDGLGIDRSNQGCSRCGANCGAVRCGAVNFGCGAVRCAIFGRACGAVRCGAVRDFSK